MDILGWSLNANFAKIRGFYFSEFVAIFPNFSENPTNFGEIWSFFPNIGHFSEFLTIFPKISAKFSEKFGKNRNFSELFGKIKTTNFDEIGI